MTNLTEQYQRSATQAMESATCLPFAVYHDEAIFRLEVEKVFHNEWVFTCDESQLKNPGDYFALSIAGEPVVVLRDKQGHLKVLSNVCRHRGTPLLDQGFGSISGQIVCPYHAWTYDDSGNFKGAPFPGDVVVDKKAHCLPQFHLATWMGLIFVHLGKDPQPLEKRFEDLASLLSVYQLDKFKHGYVDETYQWQANWKLVVENAVESYHLFKVHKQTLEKYTPTKQTFYIAGGNRYTVTGGKFNGTGGKLMKWLSGDYPEAYDHYVLVFLPPGFVAILTYQSFDWINVVPDGPEHSIIYSGGLYPKAGKSSKLLTGFNQAFMAEDKVMCERVHKGMKSRLSQGGKLVSLEQPLLDFRHFLADKLFAVSPPAHQITESVTILSQGLSKR